MKTLPWLISVTVHGLVLLIGSLALQQAVVGIAPGRNSIEVNLVAAPSKPVTPIATPPQNPTEEPVSTPDPPPLPSPVVEMPLPPMPADPVPRFETMPTVPSEIPSPPAPSPELLQPSHSTSKLSHRHTHDSTRDTGKDDLATQSIAGAIIDEEPDYLSNPAPIYPQDARDQGQEGVVTLDVIVDTNGRPETVQVSSTSGYYLLDDAAREAVEHYKFRPAMLNGIKVRSHVKVPIRFRLDS